MIADDPKTHLTSIQYAALDHDGDPDDERDYFIHHDLTIVREYARPGRWSQLQIFQRSVTRWQVMDEVVVNEVVVDEVENEDGSKPKGDDSPQHAKGCVRRLWRAGQRRLS